LKILGSEGNWYQFFWFGFGIYQNYRTELEKKPWCGMGDGAMARHGCWEKLVA
jgi:hypothetical protein